LSILNNSHAVVFLGRLKARKLISPWGKEMRQTFFFIPFVNYALEKLSVVSEKAFLKTTSCEAHLVTVPVPIAASGRKI
jgi:hypothetical protein